MRETAAFHVFGRRWGKEVRGLGFLGSFCVKRKLAFVFLRRHRGRKEISAGFGDV